MNIKKFISAAGLALFATLISTAAQAQSTANQQIQANKPPPHTPPSCAIWGAGWPIYMNAVDNYSDPIGSGFATYQNTTNPASFSVFLDVVANYDCPLQYTSFFAQSWSPSGYISYLAQDLYSKLIYSNPEGTIWYWHVGDNLSGRPFDVEYIDPGAGPWLVWPWGALIEMVGVAAGNNSVIVGASAPVYYSVGWGCNDCNYSPEPPPDCGAECGPDPTARQSTSVAFAMSGPSGVYQITSRIKGVVFRDATHLQLWLPVVHTTTTVTMWHVITSTGGKMTLDVVTASGSQHSVLSNLAAKATSSIPADLATKVQTVSGNVATEELALVLAIPARTIAPPTFAKAPNAEWTAANQVR